MSAPENTDQVIVVSVPSYRAGEYLMPNGGLTEVAYDRLVAAIEEAGFDIEEGPEPADPLVAAQVQADAIEQRLGLPAGTFMRDALSRPPSS